MPRAKEMGRELTDEISEWAKENNITFSLHVLSNGSLINEGTISWLSSYGARLQIPVDGAPEVQ